MRVHCMHASLKFQALCLLCSLMMMTMTMTIMPVSSFLSRTTTNRAAGWTGTTGTNLNLNVNLISVKRNRKRTTELSEKSKSVSVILDPTLDDERVSVSTVEEGDIEKFAVGDIDTDIDTDIDIDIDAPFDSLPNAIQSLFAWVSRAFAGETEYDNLMLAMAAIFGTNLPLDSEPLLMVEHANSMLPPNDEQCTGAPIPKYQREEASLGAMGAAQWTGQWNTRPHALLDVSNITTIDEWIRTLPRGCKRTLKKANAQHFNVEEKTIYGNQPAPHSSLAHFRCVVEHEVRLIAKGEDDVNGFLNALAEAVNRYLGTTRMTGIIQEYRNQDGKVIAFAHEVRKGDTFRGQWFYGDDEAAKSYVWFHSVQELVRRSIEADGIHMVDLGPSGSDAFSELKAKYGFVSVDDWPAFCNYNGPFYYEDDDMGAEDNDERQRMMDLLKMLGQ